MPPPRNSAPVPIDKSKYGMNPMSPSHLMDIKKMAAIARVNATKVEGTNNHNLATDIYQTRRAGMMISALKTIPRAFCYTCPVSAQEQGCQWYITTIAGTGTLGYSGDNGQAITATFNNPYGIALDSIGNVYVADTVNNVIRKIDVSTGIITKFAGGNPPPLTSPNGDGYAAIDSVIYSPRSIAFDAFGDMYIAEAASHRIRKIDTTTGIITTIAGTGVDGYTGDGGLAINATMGTPSGLCVDSMDNVYFADIKYNSVRKIDLFTGFITKVAGRGVVLGDGGAATAALLSQPYGIDVDSRNNIYITEFAGHRVRKVNATSGIITTIVGTGSPGYTGDGGPSTLATVKNPSDICVDSDDNIYIADTFNYRIRRIDGISKQTTTFAGTGGYPGATRFDGDGGLAVNAAVGGVFGICLDSSGNIYTAGASNVIRKLYGCPVPPPPRPPREHGFYITTIAGTGTRGYNGDGIPATSARINPSYGVCVDSSFNVYFIDDQRIRKVDTSGVITTLTGTGRRGYSGDGGPAISAEIDTPFGICADSVGNVYIADNYNCCIRKVDTSGVITTVAGNGTYGYSGDGGPAISATLNIAASVWVDSSGTIYIADNKNNCIRKVNTSGVITTVAGNGGMGYSGDGGAATSANLTNPFGVCVDSVGNIYIADTGNSVIRKVTASTGIITTIAGTGVRAFTGDGGAATSATLQIPRAVYVDSVGNVYIADTGNYRIRKVDATTQIITTIAGTLPGDYIGDRILANNAYIYTPFGICMDSAGKIYIADTYNNRIRNMLYR
jgi:streptogramin lyase